jgi:hypothetical protein
MRYCLFIVIVAMLAVLATASTGLADPNLPNISPHRHFVASPTGALIQVGPRVCDNPAMQRAFNQFHSNVHVAVPGSPGPDVSAHGLHNGFGADLTFRPCSFTG